MTKETQTVWRDSKGNDLVVEKPNGKYYIVPTTVDIETTQELARAFTDIWDTYCARQVEARPVKMEACEHGSRPEIVFKGVKPT